MQAPLRNNLLSAFDAITKNHSLLSTTGLLRTLREHIDGEEDAEMDQALIRLQFLLASRRYLQYPWRHGLMEHHPEQQRLVALPTRGHSERRHYRPFS